MESNIPTLQTIVPLIRSNNEHAKDDDVVDDQGGETIPHRFVFAGAAASSSSSRNEIIARTGRSFLATRWVASAAPAYSALDGSGRETRHDSALSSAPEWTRKGTRKG